MKALIIGLGLLAVGAGLNSQQVADSSYSFPNAHPAFPNGAGPLVCVDAAHQNFHTLDGRYYPFGKLLREDGFRTVSIAQPFEQAVFADCAVVVIANALAEENAAVEGDPTATWAAWRFPHPPAFTPDEIASLLAWLSDGGALLLIMDHLPFPGAASDLASLIGVVPLDGRASYSIFGEVEAATLEKGAELTGLTPAQLRQALGDPGRIGDHPILDGREGIDQPVKSVMSFGGSAFFPSLSVQPLLELPAGARGTVTTPDIARELSPEYAMNGWLAGGALEFGKGRVVILGEAAMCSAQVSDGRPMGMNHLAAVDNPQFCLNVVRWLVGII